MPANHPVEPPPCPPELEVPRETILAAIARLDDDLREVIELHELEGLSYREIGSRIDIPPGTVGTRLVRARARLRALLEAAVGEGQP
jgi:RNA polymerase sigma-70 factor (ECF subfamily)